MYNKKAVWLVMAGLMLVSVVGCGGAPATEPPAATEEVAPATEAATEVVTEEPASTEPVLVVGWSGPQLLDAFQIDLAQGVMDMAEELNVKVIHIENNNDPVKQANDLEDLLAQDIDVLLIGGADADSIVPAIREANEMNIPVFTEDQGASGGKVIAHFGNDNYCMGYRSMETLAELVNHQGKVMHITGVPGTLIVTWNSDAAKALVATEPDMELVMQAFANWDPAQAMAYTEDVLTANPDLAGIYVHSSVMTSGPIQALQAQGLIGQVKIVSGAWDQESQDWMAAGYIQATVEYRSYEGGRQTLQTIYDYMVNGVQPTEFFNSWPMTMHLADGSSYDLQCPVGDWSYEPPE